MGKGAAAGAVAVGIAALIAGWKIKEAGEKKRLRQAYDAGYARGMEDKQRELQATITNLQNKNTQLTNTIETKNHEIASKNEQLTAKDQEIAKLKLEIEKLKQKDGKDSTKSKS
jgi:peptidoglycan hydrolase CwlO-like protein